MRLNFLLVLVLFLTAGAHASGSQPKLEIVLQASASLQRGNDLVLLGRPSEAREFFAMALGTDLTDFQRAKAHNGICVTHIMEEQWAEAMEHCNQAIRIVPTNWRFYNNRGNIYLETGEIDRAMAEYDRGLRLAPKSLIIQGNMELAEGRAEGVKLGKPKTTRPV